MKHDELVERLRRAARAVSLEDAARGFVASLGSASKRHRTVLAHLAYATNLPAHRFVASRGESAYHCAICGASAEEEVDAASIDEGLAKGDSVTASPASALVDLEGYATLPHASPTPEDVVRFDAMLDALANLPDTARATDLAKAWAPLVPRSNAYMRAALVETFGVCGILETPDHPGHLTRWVGFWEYEEVPNLGGDARPPEAWWRAAHGVNAEALEHVFGKKLPKASATPRVIEPRAVMIPKKGKKPALELRPGDLVTIEYLERWISGVVLGAHSEGDKTLPVIEFFEGSFTERPSAQLVDEQSARVVGPYREAPTWRREPLALTNLELFGPVMPVRLEVLMSDRAPPACDAPFRVVAARNLLYLLTALIAGAPREAPASNRG